MRKRESYKTIQINYRLKRKFRSAKMVGMNGAPSLRVLNLFAKAV